MTASFRHVAFIEKSFVPTLVPLVEKSDVRIEGKLTLVFSTVQVEAVMVYAKFKILMGRLGEREFAVPVKVPKIILLIL